LLKPFLQGEVDEGNSKAEEPDRSRLLGRGDPCVRAALPRKNGEGPLSVHARL
jgi:hypothetical protein